ncbi:Glucose/arabinose dehydrogenase, beta-propeller fold [Prosthecobacter debontii]|uniref:Glucose/arabinose dehydrogenase, beta-propeller fold n=1 Tax=Prosthecobacter debontii TaxID=48467 RepID=A0A1T4YPR2_9BACT|nr:sorbosone dehydrogenase family protein [Prosthecobacter debontii]SKB03710.1 Glucose/arabinose dehydrogenase, beta-propeller fold [Prosthecobacter debontii]
MKRCIDSACVTWAIAVGMMVSMAARADEKLLLTGQDAMGDWTSDAPGVRRKIRVEDLPAPAEKESAMNRPKEVKPPDKAWPQVPPGFEVTLYQSDLKKPRRLMTAPNGDILVAESKSDQITLLRDADGDGKPELRKVFAKGLNQPFGLAFYPPGAEPTHLYIGNTDAVVRLPYQNGDTEARAKPEEVLSLSAGGQLTGGGHWTRDIVFSLDGKRLFTSIGSKSNVDWNQAEEDRARIFESDPHGRNKQVYAWGIRNPVGLAIHPKTGELWTSVNERDELGDNLVPDYITRVKEAGFYGWPWYYMGGHQDPRHDGARPDLKNKVVTPDVILQAHSASLCLTFYEGTQFPQQYHQWIFAAEHGSWNRTRRTGYKVIAVPVNGGKATGEYVDFMTGFVTPEGDVWGRPVGVTVAKDGALLVSDDTGNCIWRVAWKGE